MEKSFTYDATFKRKIILCVEKTGNRAAGRKYSVSEKCVCLLRSMKTVFKSEKFEVFFWTKDREKSL
jgi:hypothetical protein